MFDDFEFDLEWKVKDYYSENPVYNPSSWGLNIIGSVELNGESYQFNKIYVWKRQDGKVFYGQDSGCSCPTPFEDFHSYSDMIEVTKESLNTLRDILRNSDYAMRNGAQDLMYKIRDSLK